MKLPTFLTTGKYAICVWSILFGITFYFLRAVFLEVDAEFMVSYFKTFGWWFVAFGIISFLSKSLNED